MRHTTNANAVIPHPQELGALSGSGRG
jgi:hypothetical protein